MTTSQNAFDAALGPYAGLYRVLQDRMRPGRDLAADSPHQTMTRYFANGTWTPERISAHRRILTAMRDRNAGKPRDGRAVLLTAGPPGAGKTSALALLDGLRDQDSALGGHLAAVEHMPLADFVIIDPDEFKHALLTDPATRPRLPDEATCLSDGRAVAPAELAHLVHAESRHLADQLALWAREEGHNLLYDSTLRRFNGHHDLLADLAARGYTQRTLISVETPLHTALVGNATRWRDGRQAYESGADPYGGRMAPEHFIRDLYRDTADRSISRTNARELAHSGALTHIIELDRHGAGGKVDAPAHQVGEVTIHIGTRRDNHTIHTPSSTDPPTTPDAAARLRNARRRAVSTENATAIRGLPTGRKHSAEVTGPGPTREPIADLGSAYILEQDTGIEIT